MKATLNGGDFALHSRALLACAEVALKGKDAQTALTLATQAQERFAQGTQLESEWRAWAIASRANTELGHSDIAAMYGVNRTTVYYQFKRLGIKPKGADNHRRGAVIYDLATVQDAARILEWELVQQNPTDESSDPSRAVLEVA